MDQSDFFKNNEYLANISKLTSKFFHINQLLLTNSLKLSATIDMEL